MPGQSWPPGTSVLTALLLLQQPGPGQRHTRATSSALLLVTLEQNNASGQEEGRHCFSAWNCILLPLGPLEERLVDAPQGRTITKLCYWYSIRHVLISWCVCVLGSVRHTRLPHLQKGKSCLGLLGSHSEAAQQREFPTQKLIPCLTRVPALSTQYTNIKELPRAKHCARS